MVQRTAVRGISRQGRSAQGVRVMNLREDDRVSAVALVMEDEADTSAVVQQEPGGIESIDALGPELGPSAPAEGADGDEPAAGPDADE